MSFIIFVNDTSAGNAPTSFAISDSSLSTVLGCFVFFITGGGFLFVIFNHFSSLVISDNLISAVSGCFLSFVANDNSSSAIANSGLLPNIPGNGLLSTIFDSCFLFSIPPTGSQALFLPNILSCTCRFSLFFSLLFYFFLSFLPTPLARNPITFTRKRLFN